MFREELLYINGTFTYCIKYLMQLITENGYLTDHYVPL
jgi:hypothetical protein